MTLQEIIRNSDFESKSNFLKNIVEEYTINPNAYLNEYGVVSKRWITEIENSGDFAELAAEEDGYIISTCNYQILDPSETKNHSPFRISVWEAAKWVLDKNGDRVMTSELYTAFSWE